MTKLDLNYLILFVEEKLRKLVSIILYRFFPSFWPKLINSSDYDVVNLHWVNGEMLSVKDISKIKKPIVWTLHDMWAFQEQSI